MNDAITIIRRLALMCVVAGSAGCSARYVNPLTPTEPAVVWPASPDAARVRYLGQLTGSQDVQNRRVGQQPLHDFLFGSAPVSRFVTPYAVAVQVGKDVVAIADTGGRSIHLIDLDAGLYAIYDRCAPDAEPFTSPVGVAWVGEDLWIADAAQGDIAIIAKDASRSRWLEVSSLQRPAGLAYNAQNKLCYVTDASAHAVIALDTGGQVAFQFGSHGAGPGQFNVPSHIACSSEGELIVADSLNFRVQRFAMDGAFLGQFGRKGDAAGDLALPKGVAFDRDQNVWVVDAHFENVQAYTSSGALLMALGHEGAKVGEFWLPAGLCIDATGRLWVADGGNHRVQVFEILAL